MIGSGLAKMVMDSWKQGEVLEESHFYSEGVGRMEEEEGFTPLDGADDNEGYDLDKSLFVDDIRRQAQECLILFFKGKRFWAGGTINSAQLLNGRVARAVMETSIIDGVDVAYRSLSHTTPENWDAAQEFWDVKLVKSVLDECGRTNMPKCFAAGIMLVYLELCQGVDTLQRLERFNYYRKKLTDDINTQLRVQVEVA